MQYEARQTEVFARWLENLRDRKAQTIIAARVARIVLGNFGDAKSLGAGLFELRIAFGPGYRLYYAIEDGTIVILLAGGDKSSQSRDIAATRAMM